MLYYVLTTVYVLICFILLLVILLQQGKGDMASAFGGSGSQAAFGARGGATLLTKLTTVFAALFLLGSLALSIIGERGPSSVVNGAAAPPAPAASKPLIPMPTPSGTPATSSTPVAPATGTTAPATPVPPSK